MTLGELVKYTRTQKKLSQQELAEKAGIHQKNISKYEKGDVVPSAITLKAIADVLEVTTDYLLGGGGATIKDTALLRQFREVDSMPEDSKNAITNVLSAYIRDFKTRQAYAS